MRDRPVLHGQDHWRKFSDALATPWLQVGVGDAPDFETGITGTLLYARDSAGETQVELGALSGWTSGDPVVFLPSSYWEYLVADAVWVGWDTALSVPVAVILSATDGGVRIYEADIDPGGGSVAAADVTIVDAAGDFTATNVEDALAELQADHETDAAALAAHIADTSDAHDASAISIADAGNDFTATDVEGALAELQADHETDEAALAAHLADTTDAHDASAVSVVPFGTIAATDVQDALEEIVTELSEMVGGDGGVYQNYTPVLTSDVTNPTLGSGSQQIGRYVENGGLVHCYGMIVFGTSGDDEGSGTYRISLPVPASVASVGVARIGIASHYDASDVDVASPVCVLDGSSGDYFVMLYPATWPSGNLTFVGHNAPWTWAASDQLHWNVTYEKEPPAAPEFISAGAGAAVAADPGDISLAFPA